MGWELAGVVDELDELPEVGPATAETIIEYRRTDGMYAP
jgi:DNA uptake protein ComE-like DNA-binding protein